MTRTPVINLIIAFGLLIGPFGGLSLRGPAVQTAPTSATLHVKPGGSGDCNDWDDACDLQIALSVAVSSDEVWVQQGVYTPTASLDPSISFVLVSGVALYGGFDGSELIREDRDPLNNITVLSGDIDSNDITDPHGVVTDTVNIQGDNSDHVVVSSGVTETAVLDGFTITAGEANDYGGGMYNNALSSPTLKNVTFSGNSANSGGGMSNDLFCNPTLENVTFSGNSATSGGGMRNGTYSNPTLTNVDFRRNSASYGGGMANNNNSSPALNSVTFNDNSASVYGGGMYNNGSSPTLMNVEFNGNSADYGGGMYNTSSSTPTLTNMTFNSNSASTYGGGMFNQESDPTISSTTFSSNNADYGGGGMYNDASSPTITNTTFITNTTQAQGGGMANYNNSSPTLTDVTFSGNSATSGGGMGNNSSSPSLTNVTFTGNSTGIYGNGGGMANDNNSSPTLSNVTFNGNSAGSFGGGVFNFESSADLINVTLNGNSASIYGGGMFNFRSSLNLTNITFANNTADYGGGGIHIHDDDAEPPSSSLSIHNTILWGNNPDQIYNISESEEPITITHSLVQGGCGAVYLAECTDEVNGEPRFIDPDGADDIIGTPDDNLRLGRGSSAIDKGNNDALSPEVVTDLDGEPRTFSDTDLDGTPDSGSTVDLGPYEAQYGWYMTYGDTRLSAGREYRTGYHDIDTFNKTISDTLAIYSITPFLNADLSYKLAPGRLDTPPEVTLADILLARLDTAWEIATGELLAGNDDMVKSMDMRFSEQYPSLSNQIDNQIAARDHSSTAMDAYLSLLAEGNNYDQFLLEQPGRLSYLDVGSPEVNPYHDVQRLAEAADKGSRATMKLAESYFRQYTPASKELAEETLREGYDRATAMLILLSRLAQDWADAEATDAFARPYQGLIQNISEMERLFEYLKQGKNPFGYHQGYIPFLIRYDNSADPETVWNFLNVYDEAYDLPGSYFNLANGYYDDLMAATEDIADNEDDLGAALIELVDEYEAPLGELCGWDGEEIEMAGCDGGTIGGQVLVIKDALLRVQKAELEMENQLELIRIEQQRAADVAGIHRATAIMYEDDGETLMTLASEEAELKNAKSDLGLGLDIFGDFVSGFTGGGELGMNFNPYGAIAGGAISGILSFAKNMDERETAKELADIDEQRERIDFTQKANVEYAEAKIVDANSEALIKEYFLEYATLRLDRAIAFNDLQQALHKLNAMTAQVEYLLARWAEAKRNTAEIFDDPGLRLYRDWISEVAQESFDNALDWAFRTSKALDYEMGEAWQDADDIYGIVDINNLELAYNQMKTDFNDWKPPSPPPPDYTIIPLSQAMGFVDSCEIEAGELVCTTARQKFNSYVSDPANWVDLDDNNTEKSLRLTFQTSIFYSSEILNLFSTGVFNDKILRVAPVLIGDEALLDGAHDNTSVRLKQLGTCYLRRKDAVIGGQDSFSAYDFEHAIKEGDSRESRLNSYYDWINEENLAMNEIDNYGDLGLLWRSVGCTEWVLTIAKEGIDAENSDIDFAALDDILLNIKHRNFPLETPSMGSEAADFTPPAAGHGQLSASAEKAFQYSGRLVPEIPEQMPAVEMELYLGQEGGNIFGVIESAGLLGFPVNDVTISGTVSSWAFNLVSEPFSTASELTRTLTLSTTTVFTDGERISGDYVISIQGLVSETLKTSGAFTLTRFIVTPVAAFSAPATGQISQPVEFQNWSQGEPTSYLWDFGDDTTSTDFNPAHVYTQPGTYTVTLTVESLYGSDTLVQDAYIDVEDIRVYLPLVMK